MSESEIVQAFLGSGQMVVSLFSMFFAMISAYIAGLYFFLNRAPLALRFLAFFLLSIGLAFLGGAAAIQQRLQDALFATWVKLPTATLSPSVLRNPGEMTLPLVLEDKCLGSPTRDTNTEGLEGEIPKGMLAV